MLPEYRSTQSQPFTFLQLYREFARQRNANLAASVDRVRGIAIGRE